MLVHIARALKIRKRFKYAQSVQELRIRWKEESNPVYQFMESGIIVKDKEAQVTKTDLYSRYVLFCMEKKFTPKQQREFTLEVQRLGYEEKRTTKERLWIGIRLIPIEPKQKVLVS